MKAITTVQEIQDYTDALKALIGIRCQLTASDTLWRKLNRIVIHMNGQQARLIADIEGVA